MQEIDSSDVKNYPIRAINLLDNIDKHRRLALAVTSTSVEAKGVRVGGSFVQKLKCTDTAFPLVAMGNHGVSFQKDFEPIVSLVFGEGEPFEHEPVIPSLQLGAKLITNAVDLCKSVRVSDQTRI